MPDEEGWVKVTRRGRKPGLPRTEAANLRVLERERRKRARKELLNFYAWQHRETKRERECLSSLLPLSSCCGPKSGPHYPFFLQQPVAGEQLPWWWCEWPHQFPWALATTRPNNLWESVQIAAF